MKKSVKIFLTMLLLVVTFCLAACDKEESTENEQATTKVHASASELVGKWKGTEGEVSTLTLGATGSYKDDAGDLYMIGTYTVDSAAGPLTANESEYGMVITYSYDLTGNTLTLQMNGGLPRKFIKQ